MFELHGERMYGPPRDEGCAIADFLRLSLDLYRARNDVGYLDRAERCLLNHLALNQFATGDFGHRSFFAQGVEPTPSVGHAWWCCTMHGLWAYADLINFAVVADDKNLWFNFYSPMSLDIHGLCFAISTDYPQDGRINIQCNTGSKNIVTNHLRIPA